MLCLLYKLDWDETSSQGEWDWPRVVRHQRSHGAYGKSLTVAFADFNNNDFHSSVGLEGRVHVGKQSGESSKSHQVYRARSTTPVLIGAPREWSRLKSLREPKIVDQTGRSRREPDKSMGRVT